MFPFLRLPPEVRDLVGRTDDTLRCLAHVSNKIYDKLFYTNEKDVQLCTQLLHVSRQINLEATSIMRQNCIFVLAEIRDLPGATAHLDSHVPLTDTARWL